MTREQIYDKMLDILEETFELSRDEIKPDSLMFEDLDLDSIDAVDLIVKLQQFTSKKIAPEAFKAVRTVGDVVDTIYGLVQDGNGAQG
jgi:acyl carrier protein